MQPCKLQKDSFSAKTLQTNPALIKVYITMKQTSGKSVVQLKGTQNMHFNFLLKKTVQCRHFLIVLAL